MASHQSAWEITSYSRVRSVSTKRSHYRSIDCSIVLLHLLEKLLILVFPLKILFYSDPGTEVMFSAGQDSAIFNCSTDVKASCLHCCCGGHALHSCNGGNLLKLHSQELGTRWKRVLLLTHLDGQCAIDVEARVG